MADAEDLQQLVQRRLAELGTAGRPLSARQAAARSDGLVSYETLRLLRTGQHSGVISHEVADGVAAALDVPVEAVLAAAGRRIPLGPFELPKRAQTLTRSERAVVLSVVDAILGAAEQDRAAAPVRAVAHRGRRSGGTQGGAGTAGDTARRVRKGGESLR